jgi:hypothetical protein
MFRAIAICLALFSGINAFAASPGKIVWKVETGG